MTNKMASMRLDCSEYEQFRHDLEQLKSAGIVKTFVLLRDLNRSGKPMLTVVINNGDCIRTSGVNFIRLFLRGLRVGMAATTYKYAVLEEGLRNSLNGILEHNKK